MKRMIIIATVLITVASATEAATDLVQVPAACGTQADIKEVLGVNMPAPETIGKGGNSRGEDLVALLSQPSTGYWALVATMSPTSVCVVASGRNWQAIEPGTVKAF